MMIKADDLKNLFKNWSDLMLSEKDNLIKLDSVVGDGDLGLTMSDGFLAAYTEIEKSTEEDIGKLFYIAGKKMASSVPSTMGTLMASGLMQVGKSFKNINSIEIKDMAHLFNSFYTGVKERGKAELGDKTFLDGFYPGVKYLETATQNSIIENAEEALKKSQTGLEETKNMIAKHGRAAIRGDSFKSHIDPGAYVATLLFKGYVNFTKNL